VAIVVAALVVVSPRAANAQCVDGRPMVDGSCVRRQTPPPLDSGLIMFLPFRTATSDQGLSYLGDGLVELLAASFNGEVGLRAVEPDVAARTWRRVSGTSGSVNQASAIRAAREVGAGRVAYGSVVGTPRQLTIIINLVSVAGGRPLSEPIRIVGSSDSLSAMIAEGTARILGSSVAGLQTLASRFPRNPEVLDAFLQGRSHFRASRMVEAAADFERALTLDSTFALAAYWRVMLAGIESRPVADTALAIRAAIRQRLDLLPAQRTLLDAIIGPAGDRSVGRLAQHALAEQAARELDSPEAWHVLADSYLHYGALVGFDAWADRALFAFDRSFATSLRSNWGTHPLIVAFAVRDRDAFRRWYERREQAVSERSAEAQYLAAVLNGNAESIRAARERFVREGGNFLFMQTFVPRVEFERLRESLDTLTEPLRNSRRQLGFSLAINGGQMSRAHAALIAITGADSVAFDMDILRSAESDSAAGERLGRVIMDNPDIISLLPRGRRWQVYCEVALFRLRRGDTTGVASGAAQLRSDALREPRVCAAVIDAITASLSPGAGIASLLVADSVMRHKVWNAQRGEMFPHWNYDLALAFARHGAWANAAAAARRRFFARNIRLAPALRDEGRWSLAAGDTARAVAAFRWYLDLRDDPDPALVPERDSVRAALARIAPPTRRR
jgi:hypothetical protein